jgi:hypothetical protein
MENTNRTHIGKRVFEKLTFESMPPPIIPKDKLKKIRQVLSYSDFSKPDKEEALLTKSTTLSTFNLCMI